MPTNAARPNVNSSKRAYHPTPTKRKRKKKKHPLRKLIRAAIYAALLTILILLVKGIVALFSTGRGLAFLGKSVNLRTLEVPDYVDVQLIDIGNARTGIKLTSVENIVVHYVGNPGTTAQNNRDYYAKEDTEVCSHFVIGINGEIIQCVPLDEKSSASNHRNIDTISIEVCHPDADGKFTKETYDSLVKLCAWLCYNSGLQAEEVIRHYEVTGKECPRYYVKHQDAWDTFHQDLKTAMDKKQ